MKQTLLGFFVVGLALSAAAQEPAPPPTPVRAPQPLWSPVGTGQSDVERGPGRRPPDVQGSSGEVLEVLPDEPTGSQPRDVAGAGKVALLIAGVIRFLVWLAKTPVLGAFWLKLPTPARVGVIGLLTAAAAAADAIATGVNWPTAIMTALFGMTGAVASHEFQNRIVHPKSGVQK